MFNKFSTWSKLTNFFFFTGFIISKIPYLPINVFVSTVRIVSLSFYLLGYSLWIITSHLHPNYDRHDTEWYGFARFKEQHIIAAVFGLIAAITGIVGVFFPVVLILSAWLFLLSNLIWAVGEYHKLQNPPPDDEEYSHSHQHVFVQYAISMTLITLVVAISTTIMITCPAITVPTLIISAIICIGLSGFSTEYWLDCNFGEHKPSNPPSTEKMLNSLGHKPKPEQSSIPFIHRKETLFEIKPDPELEDSDDESSLLLRKDKRI